MSEGIDAWIDVLHASDHRLHVSLDAAIPKSGPLNFAFARWVPGSYSIRDPIRHAHDFRASTDLSVPAWSPASIPISCKLVGSNRLSIRRSDIGVSERMRISWTMIANEVSVRTNHASSDHVFISPPCTWFLPDRALLDRSDRTHVRVHVRHPIEWSVHSALTLESRKEDGNVAVSTLSIQGLDAWMDSPLEVSAAPVLSRQCGGLELKLRISDIGAWPLPEGSLELVADGFERLLGETEATLGPTGEGPYALLLLLTDGPRGGLEHRWGQVSMMPRKCLQDAASDEREDLWGLLSHELVHLWNVKQLRPTSFDPMDLEIEVHEPLLWWFEGITSWIGDHFCLRSGLWDQETWLKWLGKKVARHLAGTGSSHQSVAEAGHRAWSQTYRPDASNREARVSYYLEAELAALALDVEIRRRTKGIKGLDDAVALAVKRHGWGASEELGLSRSRILKVLRDATGCRLGRWINEHFESANRPPLETTLRVLGIHRDTNHKEAEVKNGWIGVEIHDRPSDLRIRRLAPLGPARGILEVGDEIIAVNGERIRNSRSLSSLLESLTGHARILVARHGILRELSIDPCIGPEKNLKFKLAPTSVWNSMSHSKKV